MSTKLTLYIEEELIEYVKGYAKEHQLSVSKVVTNFLTSLQQKQGKNKHQTSTPLTDALLGSVASLDTSKEAYHKHLDEKYQ